MKLAAFTSLIDRLLNYDPISIEYKKDNLKKGNALNYGY